jgi:hypothetical protein
LPFLVDFAPWTKLWKVLGFFSTWILLSYFGLEKIQLWEVDFFRCRTVRVWSGLGPSTPNQTILGFSTFRAKASLGPSPLWPQTKQALGA